METKSLSELSLIQRLFVVARNIPHQSDITNRDPRSDFGSCSRQPKENNLGSGGVLTKSRLILKDILTCLNRGRSPCGLGDWCDDCSEPCLGRPASLTLFHRDRFGLDLPSRHYRAVHTHS